MKHANIALRIAPGLIVLFALPAYSQVVITPSTPPAVNEADTFQFTASQQVTWSMAPGSRGTIDANGVYYAPASVTPQQSLGGCQLLPNNHVYNTRVDSLPVHPSNATWMSVASSGSVNYLETFPVNHIDASTPTQSMSFYYTSGNNGTFQIPPYPIARIESGWFVPPFSGPDRHLTAVDTGTCVFQEMYNLYAAGTNTDCPSCNSQSGVRYSGSQYGLPVHLATDAASLYLLPLSLHLQELQQGVNNGGSIKHALRVTMPAGWVGSSFNAFIWPAMAASPGGGPIPYGARFRLKAGFDTSTYSPVARVLMNQLKQYGMILSDIGGQWQITIDYERWPQEYEDAFKEVAAAVNASALEAVDESSLMISASSGMTRVNAETVIATNVSNPAQSASMQVVLTGVTIDVSSPQLYVQGGTLPQQLNAWVHGTSNKHVTWSMSPLVGTLTAAGVYAPPASVTAATVTTVTAISAADLSAFAQISLTVLPDGSIRIILGQDTPYTDTKGNVWQARTGDDNGHGPYDNGGTWPSTPDIYLYQVADMAYTDLRFDFSVPNGNYNVTAKFAETEPVSPGERLMNLEVQGNVVYSNVDIFSAAGGMNKPVDYTLPARVTNGKLAFVLRKISGGFAIISALEIAPTTDSTISPLAEPTNLRIIR